MVRAANDRSNVNDYEYNKTLNSNPIQPTSLIDEDILTLLKYLKM